MQATYLKRFPSWCLFLILAMGCLCGCAAIQATMPHDDRTLQERVANDPFPTAHQAGIR